MKEGFKMTNFEKIEVLGDSILKGVQINPKNNHYYTKNDIDFAMLSETYSLTITNESRFGCTVTKGSRIIQKKLEQGLDCDAMLMDFGGNDCDYQWSQIAQDPTGNFEPTTPLALFRKEYTALIRLLKEKNIVPIITTLPPLEPQRFFQWWCKNLNKENILKWLGSVDHIYNHQASYSTCIEEIAQAESIPLIDIRSAFLTTGNAGSFMCEDGTHPNSQGQGIITQVFSDFIKKYIKTT